MRTSGPSAHVPPVDFASDLLRFSNCLQTDETFPKHGEPASFVETRIRNYSLLDFKPQLNTASYINVVAEPEEQSVALSGLAVNIADQTVYPGSMKCHNDALNMVASLWHCPKPPSFIEHGCYPGAGTVGSTEACLLAGLAMKFRWRKWYASKNGMNEAQVRREYPNLVISTLYQACWEKLFKYMDVEPRFAPVSVESFCIDPSTLAGLVDDHTIGVVCILGNHYAGQYDPVAEVGKELEALNQKHGWQVGELSHTCAGGACRPRRCQQARALTPLVPDSAFASTIGGNTCRCCIRRLHRAVPARSRTVRFSSAPGAFGPK
eukprot:scaffold263002_cov31-Tisochrysis_lutea.AAC.1